MLYFMRNAILFFLILAPALSAAIPAFTDEPPKITRAQIEAANPEKIDIWREKKWNHEEYSKTNLPIVVSTLEDTTSFSKIDEERGRGFLDLPIYMPDQGWKIPPSLEQFKELISKAVQCEKLFNTDFEQDHYVYITIAQSFVEPNMSQRRRAWHADSYRRKMEKLGTDIDHIYLAYDIQPTLFSRSSFDFNGVNKEDLTEVLDHFNNGAEPHEKVEYPTYTLLRLDPYVVHNANTNTTEDRVFRTFARLSISKKRYRNASCSHNNLFEYNWESTSRWNRQQHLK